MPDTLPIAYDALLDAMTDLVILLDQDEKIVHINTAAETFFGISRDDWAGENSDSATLNERLGIQRLLEGKNQSEVMVADLQGEAHPMEMNRCMVTGQDSKSQGTLITLHDITARHNTHLFLTLSAFDMSAPLHFVIGYLTLIQEKFDSLSREEINDVLERAITAADTIMELRNFLIDYAGIFGGSEVSVVPLAMGEIVQAVLASGKNHIERVGITVNNIPETWTAALGDARWVKTIWHNLIINAEKYADPPPVITLGSDTAVNGQARFWVRASGTPLEEEATGRRVFNGVLGLIVVRDMVERMGGEVGVESIPGEGNLFYFTLPTATPEDES